MTNTPTGPTNEPSGLGWALLAAAMVLPWLIGYHVQPWTTFYGDWAMAAMLVPVAAWAIVVRRECWPVGRLAAGTMALAGVPLLQAATGRLLYAQDGWLVAVFLAAVALAIMLARRCEDFAPGRLADAMFAGLAAAALLSTGLALYQWLGFDTLGMLVQPLPTGGRAIANVGQPNLLATLLLWGILSFWWAYLHRRIGAATAVLAIVFLLFGLTATQSRTGLLGALLIAAAAAAFGSRSAARPIGALLPILLGVSAVGLAVVWPTINHEVMIDAGLTLAQQVQVGRRPLIWGLMLDAVRQAPWFGYGWNQGFAAQQAGLDRQAPMGLVIQHSHNLVIDLMVWNGVIVGALASFGLLAWFVARWRRLRETADVVLLLCPTVLLLHAMLELPHVHLIFLVPAAIAMGTVDARAGAGAVVHLPRAAVATLATVLSVFATMVLVDYRNAEQDLMATRIRLARIGDLTPVEAPRLLVLGQLEGVLRSLRVTPRAGLEPRTLRDLERSVARYPSDGGLYKLAQARALNEQPTAALRALDMLCRLYNADTCARAGRAWQEAALTSSALQLVVLPAAASPGRTLP